MKKISSVFILLLLFSRLFLQGQSPYPEIKNLQSDDVFFNQYSVAVAMARRAIARFDTTADITPEFYTYTVKPSDTLIQIAARCCIPYDAIATLNRIASKDDDIEGRRLLLPSLPGLYVYKKPSSTLEQLVREYVDQTPSEFEGFVVPVFDDKQRAVEVYCLPNALFNGTIRAFFFLPYYTFPLESRRITSGFGLRKDPFTGHDSHHTGLDIAAPLGAKVSAITGGIITYTGTDRVLGKHIILQHKDGRESVYGHLSKINVCIGDIIKVGTVIGEVGATGRATGNHLHLEIRESSRPTDPARFFIE